LGQLNHTRSLQFIGRMRAEAGEAYGFTGLGMHFEPRNAVERRLAA
jgi:hypothetical protein